MSNEGWITSSIIDVSIHAYLQDSPLSSNIINVLCRHSLELFRMQLTSNHVLSQIPFVNKILVMPINMPNDHWCLALADFKSKTYTYQDPRNIGNCGTYFSTFLKTVAHRNAVSTEFISTQGWRCLSSSDIPRQNDVNNCGVFVIYYALLSFASTQTVKTSYRRSSGRVSLIRSLKRVPT